MRFSVIGLCLIGLSACSGSDSPPSSQPSGNAPIVGIDDVNSKYVLSAASDVEALLKDNIGISLIQRSLILESPVADVMVATTASAESSSGSDASGFSTTNVQEVGVEEGDRIKYDGDYMYFVEQQDWHSESGVKVLKRQTDNQLTQVNLLNVDDSSSGDSSIYLGNDGQTLARVFNNQNMYFAFSDIRPGYIHSSPFSVVMYDTSTPESASTMATLRFDGSLIDSRRIDDELYLVSAYAPNLDGWIYYPTAIQELQNQLLLDNVAVEQLLPMYTRDGGQPEPMFSADQCYMPKAEDAPVSQVISIIRINMTEPSEMEAMCVLGDVNDIYVSQNNMYLVNRNYDNTAFDKFSLAPNMAYQASGEVAGSLGWNNPMFRLSEYQDEFRVVYSDYSDTPTHYLTVMEQDGARLVPRATLPNTSQPEPIGKPNEDIYAVRYFGERAYIVTFERTDPLYVIDLPVDDTPVIVGSLEIPGFSSYLHPMDNNFLLGVGQEVRLIDLGNGAQRVQTTGMKVSLFDINNPSAPVEVSTLVKQDGYTPVEYDHRALSVLKLDDTYRFGLPLQQWTPCSGEVCTAQYKPSDSMLMLEVDTALVGGKMTELRQWSIEDNSGEYIRAWLNRSILHKDEGIDLMYFLRGNQVYSTPWAVEGETQGPF
jgi:uncharacterized secreted protein with C-terminal beta-propeller domain